MATVEEARAELRRRAAVAELQRRESGQALSPDIPQGARETVLSPRESRAARGVGAFEDFLDPSVKSRGTLLPIGRTQAGELTFAVPEIGVDVLKAIDVPGRAFEGQRIDPLEVTAAATVIGPGVLRGATRPIGKAVANLTKAREASVGREVVKAGEELGVDVLTTDVVRPKGIIGGLARQVGERIPVLGTGGKRAAQSIQRQEATESFIAQFPPASNTEIVQSLKLQTNKIRRAAGNVIEGFQTRMSELGDINTQNIVREFNSVIDELSKPGKLKDQKSIASLQAARDQFIEAPQNFKMLRENRTAVRELAEATDALGRSQLPSAVKARIKRVERAFTETMDNVVLGAEGPRGLAKYKRADSVWASEANKLTKTRLKNVLDKGDITPETVEGVLFSAKPSEAKALHDSLTPSGRAAARSALVSRLVDKAGGLDDLSPTKFGNELKRLSENTGVFFKGNDLKRIRGLEVLLNHTKQAQASSVTGPTGQALQPLVAAVATSIAGLPATLGAAATAGLSARLYESPSVRNMLLQLSGAKGDPKKIRQILKRHERGVAAAMQTIARREITEEAERGRLQTQTLRAGGA